MIGIIVAVHSVFPERLLNSLAGSSERFHLYIFFHGDDAQICASLVALSRSRSDITLFNYGINRGLSRSWNDGIVISRRSGDQFTLLVNDDLHFVPTGFDQFIQSARQIKRDYGIITVNGLEIGNSPVFGHILPQDFACCIVGQSAINAIGYFDTNFHPAYFEDMDYKYRMSLADLPIIVVTEKLVEHDRTSTTRINRVLSESFNNSFSRNKKYYIRKWGGEPGAEVFSKAFDRQDQESYLNYEQTLLDPESD